MACCFPCNSAKRDRPADDFLRSLHLRGALSLGELELRLAALHHLRATESPKTKVA